MLGDIEPVVTGSAFRLSSTMCFQAVNPSIPEIEIVDRSLLISHIDVEGKQVNRSTSLTAEDLKERRQAIAIEIGMR